MAEIDPLFGARCETSPSAPDAADASLSSGGTDAAANAPNVSTSSVFGSAIVSARPQAVRDLVTDRLGDAAGGACSARTPQIATAVPRPPVLCTGAT